MCKKEINKSLIKAASTGDLETFNRLVKRGADLAAFHNWPLRMSVKKGKGEIVKFLLNSDNKDIDPAVDDNLLIQISSRRGYFEITYLLTKDPRVDITANNHNALYLAVTKKRHDIVKILIEEYHSRGLLHKLPEEIIKNDIVQLVIREIDSLFEASSEEVCKEILKFNMPLPIAKMIAYQFTDEYKAVNPYFIRAGSSCTTQKISQDLRQEIPAISMKKWHH